MTKKEATVEAKRLLKLPIEAACVELYYKSNSDLTAIGWASAALCAKLAKFEQAKEKECGEDIHGNFTIGKYLELKGLVKGVVA